MKEKKIKKRILLAVCAVATLVSGCGAPADNNPSRTTAVAVAEEEHRCPLCKGLMEKGFTIDSAGEFDYPQHAQWGQGEPVRKNWLANEEILNPKEITTWRCTSCGFLESFAW